MSTAIPSTQPAHQTQTTEGAHPSAIGSDTRPDTTSTTKTTMPSSDEEYPEQKHTGKVGYGPLYNQGADFTEEISGIKEEIMGKLKRNPDLAQHGKDKRTGELKRRAREGDDDEDPFATPGEKQEQQTQEATGTPGKTGQGEKEQAATVTPQGTREAETQRKGDNAGGMKNIG